MIVGLEKQERQERQERDEPILAGGGRCDLSWYSWILGKVAFSFVLCVNSLDWIGFGMVWYVWPRLAWFGLV